MRPCSYGYPCAGSLPTYALFRVVHSIDSLLQQCKYAQDLSLYLQCQEMKITIHKRNHNLLLFQHRYIGVKAINVSRYLYMIYMKSYQSDKTK